MASNQILKSKCRMDSASLAQMSPDSGLHSGAAPQVSETEQSQKAARFIGNLHGSPLPWPLTLAFRASQGADNPTKGLVPESGHWKVLSPVGSSWVCWNLLTGPQGSDRISL